MNSASACSCSPSDQFNMVPSNWTYRSAQIAQATIAGEQSTDIEIQTADGSLSIRRADAGWRIESPISWPANNHEDRLFQPRQAAILSCL